MSSVEATAATGVVLFITSANFNDLMLLLMTN